MHDCADAPHRVAKRRWVGEVAECDLYANALGSEAPRVTHQATHRLSFGDQSTQ
jgi:hypothetical protein